MNRQPESEWGVFGHGFVPGRSMREPRTMHLIDMSKSLPAPLCGTRGNLLFRARGYHMGELHPCRNCLSRERR